VRKNSRGDRTPLELFLTGIRGLSSRIILIARRQERTSSEPTL
jgi:hypothetical protein